MKRKLISIILVLGMFSLGNSPALAAIDLQADLNRIVAGINRFDANSAAASSVTNIGDIKRIFSNNAAILREIKAANAAFKRDLNSAKSQIPSRDTKNSPAFNTLMNLAKGYEQWLNYQFLNQSSAEKCISSSGSSYKTFSACSIASLSRTIENERIGRQKLEAAWNAWKKWQIKYGYA